MLNKKRSVLFILVVALTTSTVFWIAKLSESHKMVKEGNIKAIEHYRWDYASTVNWDQEQYAYCSPVTTRQWSKPPNTVLHFEDGETILFAGIWENIEVGKKYGIVYHEQHVYAQGNFYWSGDFFEIDSVEEIE